MGIIKKMYSLWDKPLRGKRSPFILLRILSLLIVIFTAVILLPMAEAGESKPSVVNNGPLDIRLVGVCPDGGEQMYDASGHKLQADTLGPLGAYGYWKDESQHRDFVFEVPNVNEQLIFLPLVGICPAGTNYRLGGGWLAYFDQTNNPSTLICSSTFKRTYRKQVFHIPLKKKIRHVDLTLRYFYGPRGQATCTFTGPFTMNQTVEADGAKPYYLTFKEGITMDCSGIILRFETSERFGWDVPAILYDVNGRRYMLDDTDSSRSGDKTELQYQRVVVLLENIAAITFGEKPREITFKNLIVDYPDRPHRNYPEFLDEMSKRLGLTNELPKDLVQYDFRNPAEAIEVIDIIRGEQQIRKAFNTIRDGKPKIDIAKLDRTTQDKIRRTAKTWAQIDILAVYGIQLGLMGQWPEFFDMAIERLGREEAPSDNGNLYYERTWRQDDGNIANTMVNYRMDQLTVEQVQKLKELILKTNNGSVSNLLLYYLEWTQSRATTDALWELARSEKPWIWWQATEAWYSRESRIRNVYDGLPEKMKLRVILVERNVRDENLKAKALALLPEILTPEMAKMAFSFWFKVYEGIAREFDRTDATEIYINCLRRMQSEMTVRQWTTSNAFKSHTLSAAADLIRTLNVWYGTNIGNLGTDEMGDTYIHTSIRTYLQFRALMAETLQWYDGNKNMTPVGLPFAGKVVDTSGIPVVGAQLSFTKIKDYEDEYGDQSQRRVSIGQCRTDTKGRFSFDVEENGEHYLFDITAEGFVPKQILDVQRLIDGRYRYREEAAPEDNVVVLQRSGKISGIVFGADGKPLADAELTLSTVNMYSHAEPRRTVRTDSEGKFTTDDVTKGPYLLSYADIIQIMPYEKRYREEYGGLCGAVRLETEEAGHLTDVVLDLSKSDCSLELQVVDDANEPIQDISFTLDARMEGGNYKYATIFSVREVSEDGVYRFEGMPPGAWNSRIRDSHKYSGPKRINIDLTRGKTARYKVTFE